MSLNNNLNKILIIDFGSQFTQLIARRIRELGIFSVIINHKKANNLKIFNNNIRGIILSGGPLNVYDSNKFNQKLMNDNLGFVKDSINGVLNTSIGVKIIVDTKVEKIEEEPNNDSINQNDVVELFQGKDTM